MTMVKPTVTASYTLRLPAGTEHPPSLTPTVTHTFPLGNSSSLGTLDLDPSTASADVREYYDSVRAAIAAARIKLGEELTAWRDAVGNGEAGKERKLKAAKEEDEEDEDEGEA
ncbi:hypothetical protein EDD16DRAFT_1573569 [Pisolithus croceorrhizus]|nr:hypothetical protein EDD16DRAFT_1573569 [Pisolithus croceorrhizus]